MNSIFGDDNNLKSDRDKLDIYLNRLQDATEYAILDNTEKMLEQQARLGDVVADMRRELGRNRETQEQIAANQLAATEKISNDVQEMMKDIKKLLSLQQETKSVKSQNAVRLDEFSGNVVRHFYGYVARKGLIPDKPEEQIEVCSKFVLLISDHRYAGGLVKHPRVRELKDVAFPESEKVWANWSSHALKLNLAPEAIEYWQDPGKALYPLSTALVQYWLKTLGVGKAIKAWRWAESIYGDGDAFRQASNLGGELDSQAYFAIALVLALDENNQMNSAVDQLQGALM